jgi:DNA-binding CsgD family transcriptional regulator
VRDEGERDFDDDEVAFVGRISSHVGHALRGALVREAADGDAAAGRAPGVILLDSDGRVRSLTERARAWLEQIPADRGTGLELPSVIHAVARRAMTAAGATSGARAYASLRLASGGWLTVDAAMLETDGEHGGVAVSLAPAAGAELEQLYLELHGLTPRERDVALLITRGATNDEIARTLWISRHTVKDHVKSIYAKTGVASRAELSSRLFHDSIASRVDARQIGRIDAATET